MTIPPKLRGQISNYYEKLFEKVFGPIIAFIRDFDCRTKLIQNVLDVRLSLEGH